MVFGNVTVIFGLQATAAHYFLVLNCTPVIYSVHAIDKAQLSNGKCHWQSAEMEKKRGEEETNTENQTSDSDTGRSLNILTVNRDVLQRHQNTSLYILFFHCSSKRHDNYHKSLNPLKQRHQRNLTSLYLSGKVLASPGESVCTLMSEALSEVCRTVICCDLTPDESFDNDTDWHVIPCLNNSGSSTFDEIVFFLHHAFLPKSLDHSFERPLDRNVWWLEELGGAFWNNCRHRIGGLYHLLDAVSEVSTHLSTVFLAQTQLAPMYPS